MKKVMTKSLSLFLAVMMLLTCFAGIDVEAFASSSVKTKKVDGVTYSYTVKDSKVTITGIEPNKKKTVSIPSKISGNTVKTIGEYALNDYDDTVTTVKIPNTVTKLAYLAINYCASLKTVEIGSGLKTIDKSAFNYCPSIKEFTVNKNNKNFSTYNKSLYNKSQTKIYTYAAGKTTKEVTLPKTVKTIGTGAFRFAQNVEKITLPSSVTAINSYAFFYCPSLKSINIPSKVTSIGVSAFQYCGNLKSINLSKTKITKISDYMFDWCENLATIKLPSTIEKIGKYAFAGTLITSFTASSKITAIGAGAFEDCPQLKSVDISKAKITKIGDYMFSWSNNLATIKLPSSIEKIGWGAFESTGIKSFTATSKLTSIGEYAFDSCEKLTTVDLSKSQVKSVKDDTFGYCKNLSSVTLPNKLEKIYDEAFYDCAKLEKITIPATVTSVRDEAFAFTNLKQITVKGKNTSLYKDAFWGVSAYEDGSLIIKAPKNSKAQTYAKKHDLTFKSI